MRAIWRLLVADGTPHPDRSDLLGQIDVSAVAAILNAPAFPIGFCGFLAEPDMLQAGPPSICQTVQGPPSIVLILLFRRLFPFALETSPPRPSPFFLF